MQSLSASNCGLFVLPCQCILVLTDNKSTELALNFRKSCVPFTPACLRELWPYADRGDFKISAHHIAGSQNVIANCLSSWDLNTSYQQQFYDTVLPLYGSVTEEHCTPEMVSFKCPQYIERGLLPAHFVKHVHLHKQAAFFDQKIKYTEHVLSKWFFVICPWISKTLMNLRLVIKLGKKHNVCKKMALSWRIQYGGRSSKDHAKCMHA